MELVSEGSLRVGWSSFSRPFFFEDGIKRSVALLMLSVDVAHRRVALLQRIYDPLTAGDQVYVGTFPCRKAIVVHQCGFPWRENGGASVVDVMLNIGLVIGAYVGSIPGFFVSLLFGLMAIGLFAATLKCMQASPQQIAFARREATKTKVRMEGSMEEVWVPTDQLHLVLQENEWNVEVRRGDVIGLACDLDDGKLRVSRRAKDGGRSASAEIEFTLPKVSFSFSSRSVAIDIV